ncbi:hypothetical protein DPMN_092851 [Dreissena polymorpha]|uniref:Uncharacterized protein n=1 Tax=Dreissena polymorpha TaxID=45954 RepID=A0A9D4R232_DREPO|nr:hypothetical protein DPMN_092851 [Dreissena polymorpha]
MSSRGCGRVDVVVETMVAFGVCPWFGTDVDAGTVAYDVKLYGDHSDHGDAF